MTKYNTRTATPAQRAPTTGATVPDTTTGEGAPAYTRDTLTELYLLAVAYMGTGTFYETEHGRADRFRTLAAEAALTDPDWMGRFIPWLRGTAYMRTASLEAAVEAAYAMTRAGVPGGRDAVCSALQRADEPAEALAYARHRFGRTLPRAIANGIADAARRLYTEFGALKYDSGERPYRFGDVIRALHPRPTDESEDGGVQAALFRYLSRTRTNRTMSIPLVLGMTRANRAARMAMLKRGGAALAEYEPDQLVALMERAGMTWEDLASLAGETDIEPVQAWSTVIPFMGYMAMLKNLRRFDELDIPQHLVEKVAARLADPDEIARAKVLPLRFWSAHRAVQTLRWGPALEAGLNGALTHIRALAGRTLVLVDRSDSMNYDSLERSRDRHRSGRTKTEDDWVRPPAKETTLGDAAALFGSAIAKRAQNADLYWFDTQTVRVPFHRSDSILMMMRRFGGGGGTRIDTALATAYDGHDRVIIITDEQARNGRSGPIYTPGADWADALTRGERASYDVMGRLQHERIVPARVPVYVWNLAGYPAGYLPHGGNRFVFGGLSDASFSMINQIEHRGTAAWPF